MESGDLIDPKSFRAFTCLWHGGEPGAGLGWVVTLYPDRQTSEDGVIVKLDNDGLLVGAEKRVYLTIAAAAQVLRLCRQAHLQRGGYSIGPDLDHLRPDIRHEVALTTASQAIAEAWPRQTEGLPVSPAEMLRSIRRLAHAIDALLVQAESRAAGTSDDPAGR